MTVKTNFTDKIGTDAVEPSDENAVEALWNKVPKVFPEEIIVRLPYCYYSATSCAAATLTAYQQWRANSIYDPDLTGVGAQPLGHDTWTAIYNYYKVLKSTIRVEIQPLTHDVSGVESNATYASLHGLMCDRTATPPGGVTAWLNAIKAGSSNGSYKFTEAVMTSPINSGGTIVLYMEWTPSTLNTAMLDPSAKDAWTPVGSNPDILEYFSQLFYNPEAATARLSAWKVDIEYMVAFKQVDETLLITNN